MEFPIILKRISGEFLKVPVQNQTSIFTLKQLIQSKWQNTQNISSINLVFKGQQLQDQDNVGNYNLKAGDQIVVMIKIDKTKQQANNVQDNDFQTKINELIELGYDQQALMAALKLNNNDFPKTMVQLMNNESIIQQEIPDHIPTLDEQYNLLLKQPQIKELKFSIQSHTLHETLEFIANTNPKIYKIVSQKLEDLFQRFPNVENKTKDIPINEEDMNIIFQLRTLNANLNDNQLLTIYLKHNRDVNDTIDHIRSL